MNYNDSEKGPLSSRSVDRVGLFRKFAYMRALLTHPYLLVMAGGSAGSLLRYGIGRIVPPTLAGMPFPLAILLINIGASALLGLVAGWVVGRTSGEEVRLLVGVGFCGGLSTFSSFSYDTAVLLQNGRVGTALLNIGLNVILCLLGSVGGLTLGSKL